MNNKCYNLGDFPVNDFKKNLVQWFIKEQRDLPWRNISNPYYTWISEIMLQQTRVETVKDYYRNFIQKFPTINDLANAPEQEVLKSWEGLGYYSRARNLHTAVKEVAENYGGVVPNNKEELSKLKGVGPYTTGAILSIAYSIPEPAVDGNVMRVLSRILLIEDDIAKASSRKIFESAVSQLIDEDDPSSFNQGLMELGATICTPTSPSCLLCPVNEECRAFDLGRQLELPIKTKSGKVKKEIRLVGVLQNEKGEYLIRQRSEKGLLASLWEFPHIEITTKESEQHLEEFTQHLNEVAIPCELKEYVESMNHKFSHLEWELYVWSGRGTSITLPDNYKWVDKLALLSHPFPVTHQKIAQNHVK